MEKGDTMTARDQLEILNEKINKCRREQEKPYTITVQDEIDIHIALKSEKDYAKQKALDAFRAALELTWGPFTDHGERVALEKFNEFWKENK